MGWRRIVVVGDLHGLYREAVGLLSHAGVVDGEGRWCAEGVCLVFLGDVCDRGYDSASLYRAIQRWQGEAPECDSRVVFLVGNHEALNLAGISPYMTVEEMEGYVNGDEDPRVAVRRAFGKGGGCGSGWSGSTRW
ncbi:metallophosphoesterase [Spirochaeta thermophila]|uniref:Predicted hydrolase n=1 Tax=Winmispira thermophila (strain ATCC 49972 / DSM 6192 / RI 19.B1) TaxID=665571 RepID=E0RNW8_WINT6|nr:metallophosphoesterase [Spirochaeta thermophila]ADN01241.1 predicted hydrolase [Spirochaeta thermophila DSM 6192]